MIFLVKMGVGFMGAVLVGGAALSSEGFVQVKVHEKKPGGTNLSLMVPAALAPLTLKFVPDHNLADASAKLRPYLPMIDAAIPALEESADVVLVEVRDPQEHVLIRKIGGSIVVDVNDAGDLVYVAVPLGAAQASIHEIAAAQGVV